MGGKSKIPHEMYTRLVVVLSVRTISIMIKSGDFNFRESNPGFHGINLVVKHYRVVPGHRNHLNDPASKFLCTH